MRMHGSASRRSLWALAVAAASLAADLPPRSASAADESLPRQIEVNETFDGRPFAYRIESQSQRREYTILTLTYPSPVETELPQNNTVPAEYYLPKILEPDGPKRPAVICLHILGGNFELVRMTCAALASHGVPAILFKLPYYGERGPAEGPKILAEKPQLFMEALSQGLQDVRRTVDLLASRPEVDPRHIGVTGISLGGITSAAAAAIEPRLSRAVLVLAGGDIRHIIKHAPETRELREVMERLPAEQKSEFDKALAAVEPLTHAAQLRDRAEAGKVLMINAAEDTVIPPQCTRKLAAALGIAERIVWLEGLGHYTAMAALPRIMESTVAFFAADLPPGTAVQPAEVRPQTPLEMLVHFLKQVRTLAGPPSKPERCHFIDLEVTAGQNGKTIEATLRFLRGDGNRFRLETTLPEVGQVMMGHGDYPWLASGNKAVFAGKIGDEPSGELLAHVRPEYRVKAQVVTGALAGVTMAPEVLEQFVSIHDESTAGGPLALRLRSKKDDAGSVVLVFRQDGRAPQSLSFDIEGVQGTVKFRGWEMNTVADPGMFDPPGGLPVQEVDSNDLDRMFSAMLNFAMENME